MKVETPEGDLITGEQFIRESVEGLNIPQIVAEKNWEDFKVFMGVCKNVKEKEKKMPNVYNSLLNGSRQHRERFDMGGAILDIDEDGE